MEFDGDADWFAFDAVAGNRFRFETSLDTLTNSVLRLYDQDGTTLLEISDDIDATKFEFGSRIDWQAPRTGRYFLSVRGFADLRTGRYQLGLERLADDHSDDSGTATVVAIPSVTAGQLEVASDRDTFTFMASAGQEYRITTQLGTLQDSVVTVLGTDGTTVVAENDDFFVGNSASFVYWIAPADGEYYIQVASPEGAYSGSFDLTVSVDDHGDYSTPASAVAVDSRTAGSLEVAGDRDWFKFPAVEGLTYRIQTILDTLPDSILRLYGPDGTSFLSGNDDLHQQGIPSLLDRSINSDVLPESGRGRWGWSVRTRCCTAYRRSWERWPFGN